MVNPGKAATARAVAALLVFCAAGLLVAAFYYPFINASFALTLPDWLPDWNGTHERIRRWVIEQGGIVVGPRYLLDIIGELFRSGESPLGILVLGFSVLFPSSKIALTAILLFKQQLSASRRTTLLKLLDVLTKWSMGDVFVVALVVVLFKAKGFHYLFTAEIGVFSYAGSTIAASLAVFFIRKSL